MTSPIVPVPGSRHASIVIAATNSSAIAKLGADVICTGRHDDVAINAAIASLQNGGKVKFLQGQYYLSAPILIDWDWITLEGEGLPHWSKYVGAYPTHDIPGTPGGAQLVQTVSGQNGITIGTTTANMHGDTRHKGIAIRDLYLYGSNYTGTGIYDSGATDVSEISRVSIQGFSNGIQIAWDTPKILFNSIQDNAGAGITHSGYFGFIHGNLVFDISGPGMVVSAFGTTIANNLIGDIISNDGIQITGNSVKVTSNHLEGIPNGRAIVYYNGASYGAVTGNTIQLTGVNTPNKTNNTAYSAIVLGVSSTNSLYNTATGNVISNASSATSTGYAISVYGNYNVALGNTIAGGEWNGGGANTNVSVTGTGNIMSSTMNAGQQ